MRLKLRPWSVEGLPGFPGLPADPEPTESMHSGRRGRLSVQTGRTEAQRLVTGAAVAVRAATRGDRARGPAVFRYWDGVRWVRGSSGPRKGA